MVRDAILVFGVILSLCVGALLFSGDITGMQALDTCGNGIVDTGESCDDGNMQAGDGCFGCRTEDARPIRAGLFLPSSAPEGAASPPPPGPPAMVTPAAGPPVFAPPAVMASGQTLVQLPSSRSVLVVSANTTGDGVLTVAELDALPVSLAFHTPYFAILEVTLKDATTTAVLFDFKVAKPWLAAQGATADDVILYRHTSAWEGLPTAVVAEDADAYYFQAFSPGLSYFVVSIKSAPKGEIVVAPAAAPPASEAPPKSSSTTVAALMILVILAIVAGGAVMLLRRPLITNTRVRSPDIEETLGCFNDALAEGDKDAAQHHLARMERLLDDASPAVRSSYAAVVEDAFNRFGKA